MRKTAPFIIFLSLLVALSLTFTACHSSVSKKQNETDAADAKEIENSQTNPDTEKKKIVQTDYMEFIEQIKEGLTNNFRNISTTELDIASAGDKNYDYLRLCKNGSILYWNYDYDTPDGYFAYYEFNNGGLELLEAVIIENNKWFYSKENISTENADVLSDEKHSELLPGFASWAKGETAGGTLECYGLYNVGGSQGFYEISIEN